MVDGSKWEKDFDEQWDNRFLDWDLTDKLGMKERVKAFIHKVWQDGYDKGIKDER